MIRWL